MNDPFEINNLISEINGYNNPEYNNLTKEEKEDMDFVNECLYGENEKISNAAGQIMLLFLRYSASFRDNPISDEEFFNRICEITKDLSSDEIDIIVRLECSLTNVMGIYSEERVQMRKLRKERNDLNDKSK